MPDYRRYRIPGGCYFFTVNLLDRNQSLLVDQIDLLRESVKIVKQKHPFHIDALGGSAGSSALCMDAAARRQ